MTDPSHELSAVSSGAAILDDVAYNHAPLPRRIPSLDGLRAISILLVFVAHAAGTRNAPRLFDHLVHVGNLGVKVFFIISGFLITTLLLREFDKTGTISIRQFWIRRAIRIFPAFYTYIGIVVLLWACGLVELKRGDLSHAVTYTINYHDQRAWAFNHIWSLAVEEQFYLIWPGLICVVGIRRALIAAGGSVLLVPIVRMGMFYLWSASNTSLTRQFQAVADSLAVGCLLAGCYTWLGTKRSYITVLSSPLFPIIPLLGLGVALASNSLGKGIYYVFGQSIANLAIVLGIDYCVRFPDTPIGRVLNSDVLVRIGVLSYSLYLWQELFLNPMDEPSSFTTFPLNVILAVVAGLLSYHFVEQPFLRLKSRIAHTSAA